MTRCHRPSSSMLLAPRTAILSSLLLLTLLLSSHSTVTSAQSLTFSQITAAAPWDVRSEAQLAFHPAALSYYPPTSTTATQSSTNSFILYGGRGIGHQFDNDVWLYDGQSSWTIIAGTNQATNLSASPATASTTYNMVPGSALCGDSTGDNLYVVTGFTAPAYYDRSTDGGVSWTDVSDSNLPFTPRSFSTCVVDPHTGTVYMMGGLDRINGGDIDPKYNDVWSYSATTDSWSEVTDAAAWPARNALSSAAVYSEVLGTTLLYMAGGLTNTESGYGFNNPADLGTSDVWVSSNGGVDWSQLNSDAFPVRELARLSISASGVLVIAEGAVNVSSSPYPHDVWASVDGGVTWGECSNDATAVYGERRNHAMAFDQSGYLWLMAGECYGPACPPGGTKYNDVWKSGISFDDLSAVASACGVAASQCGAGARCWPIDGPCPCTVSSTAAASSSQPSVPSSSSSAGSIVVTPTSTVTPPSAASSTQAPSTFTSSSLVSSAPPAATSTQAPSSSTTTAAAVTSVASSSAVLLTPSSTAILLSSSAAATSTVNVPTSAASSTATLATTSASSAASSAAVIVTAAPSSSSAAVFPPTAPSSSTGAAAVVLTAAADSSSSSTGVLGAPDLTSGSTSSGGGGLSAGAIVGIVVGVILLLLFACILWFMYSRYRKSRRSDSPTYDSGRGAGGRARPADDTDSSESSNDMLSHRRPMDQVVQIWGTGELELNNSKQQQASTSSQLGRTSSVSHRSDISGTAESIDSAPSMSAVYVHE